MSRAPRAGSALFNALTAQLSDDPSPAAAKAFARQASSDASAEELVELSVAGLAQNLAEFCLAQLPHHPIEPRGVVTLHLLEHGRRRGIPAAGERAQPRLDPVAFREQAGEVVGWCGRAHDFLRDVPPPPGAAGTAWESISSAACPGVSSVTRPSCRAARRIRATCSTLSMR